jgi:peptidoglycan/LPS O-acetylase OafA/YrhL
MSAVANPAQALHKSTQIKSKYRPEIDGLRAFAVVAVIINHFNKDLLPSGYLGVDIFFVISGYVITSSLADRKSKNFLDFVTGFYERRIKRLVPALVVFVLITSVLISLFNPDPGGALGIGLKSLFGLSNISLYRSSTDYFAQSTELNPFTHTWSLGVEEQFYLLFPFLIWFSGFGQQTAKGARNLFFWVGVMTIASLLGFIYLYQVNQPAAYFLMPPRFWEMAAGCLVFIGFQKRARIEQMLEKVPPLLVVAAMVGVMFLPVSAAVPATIGVVLLSAVLIACLKQGTATYQFFTLEKVVYIGLNSYSLYLWHWTVLSISRWTIGIHWWSVPIQVGLMTLMAIASYKWIETPFRTRSGIFSRRTIFASGIGAVCTSFAVIAGLAIPLHRYAYLGRTSGNTSNRLAGCKIPEIKGSGPMVCLVNSSNYTRTAWIIGDSHAGKLLDGARDIFKNTQTRIALYAAGGTPFPPVGHYRKNDKGRDLMKLDSYQRLEEQLINSARDSDIIVIAMRLPYHFGGTYYEYPDSEFVFLGEDGTEVSQQEYFALWKKRIETIARRLPRVNFILFTPTPEWEKAVLLECAEQKEWFARPSGSKCEIRKDFFTGPLGLYSHIIEGISGLARRNPNVFVYDSFNDLCPNEKCEYGYRGNALYKDDDHISGYASRRIMRNLKNQFANIIAPTTQSSINP